MKYYAVTDDPNELLHYGVKGMKWGQHIFGDKPRSAGYHRALGKLRAGINKAKKAVKNSATQASINRNNKRQEKYNKAVQKTQRRINEIEGLNSLNRLQDFEKAANRQHRAENKQARYDAKMQKQHIRADKAAAKLDLKYAKNEKKMDKYIQQARQGKLKYGKLSDEQVRQITDRLGMERSARSLGSAEKTWRQQKKEALRRGTLSGLERGTAAAMEEVARAGTIYGINGLANRKKREALAKQQGREERIKNRERNKRSHKEIREDIKNETYEQKKKIKRDLKIEDNEDYKKLLDKRSERERVRKLNETINNALDMDSHKEYQALLSRQEEQKFLTDEAHNSARTARQNRENEERAERQRQIEAELAYKYGLYGGGSSNNGKGKNKGGGNGGGKSSNFENKDAAVEYYRRRYIRGETIQDEQRRTAERDAKFEAAARSVNRRLNEFETARAKNEEGTRKAQEWVANNKKNGTPLNIMPLNKNKRVTNTMTGEIVDTLIDSTTKKRKPKGK